MYIQFDSSLMHWTVHPVTLTHSLSLKERLILDPYFLTQQLSDNAYRKRYRMIKYNGIGVMLPRQPHPWILNGKDQPRWIKKVFVTPQGYFPRMDDLTMIFGRSRREVDDRRMRRKGERWDAWYVINDPTIEDVKKAIDNVNELYISSNYDEDHCGLCNSLDDDLHKKNCWLLTCDHDCGEDELEHREITFSYSYAGEEFTMNLQDYLDGDPLTHLKDKTNE